MAYVDKTYFVGELSIPNLNRAEVLESLTRIADIRQRELLEMVLGYGTYKDLLAAIAMAGSIATLPAPWIGLMSGADYTVNDRTFNWMGILDAVNKQSIIANYTYYWFLRKTATNTTGVGESLVRTENADRTNPIGKQVRAYNEMVDWCWELYHYLQANATDFPKWVPCQPLNIITSSNL